MDRQLMSSADDATAGNLVPAVDRVNAIAAAPTRTRRASEPSRRPVRSVVIETGEPCDVSHVTPDGAAIANTACTAAVLSRHHAAESAVQMALQLSRRLERVVYVARRRRMRHRSSSSLLRRARARSRDSGGVLSSDGVVTAARRRRRTKLLLKPARFQPAMSRALPSTTTAAVNDLAAGSSPPLLPATDQFPGAGARVFACRSGSVTGGVAGGVAGGVNMAACSVQHHHRRLRPVSVDDLCGLISQASIMSSMAEMMYT